MSPHLSAIVLSRGDRPAALARAVDSLRRQTGVDVEIVVVWNGVSKGEAPAPDAGDVLHVHLDENLGIPEGRNVGARHASGRLLFFLDDDAELVGTTTLASLADRLGDAASRFAAVGLRIVDEQGETAQRHVPRWGRRSATRSGEVTAFLGGVVAVRRDAFDDVGGYAGEFFYAMEETDLAWRLIDAGWRIWYDADSLVRHPKNPPGRHPDAVRRTARNRVWLVHRLLPAPLAVVYLLDWFVLASLRSPASTPDIVRGYREGWSRRVGPRRPVRWRTVARLTALGRPPVL